MTLSPVQFVRSRPRLPVLSEVVGVLAGYFAYFAVRGATEGDVEQAVEHAQLVQRFERGLGLFVEPQLRAAILDQRCLIDFADWVYVWGHWPVIAGVAVWLYRSQRERYRLVRNAMLISGAIGLVIFTTFPVVPPRLAEMGLVDTVVERSNFYRVLQPPALTNQYAAVPSLHFGWNLLIGIALVRGSSRSVWRVAGLLLPAAMLVSVVVTGNHYIVDTIVGGAIALLGLRFSYVVQTPCAPERGWFARVARSFRHPLVPTAAGRCVGGDVADAHRPAVRTRPERLGLGVADAHRPAVRTRPERLGLGVAAAAPSRERRRVVPVLSAPRADCAPTSAASKVVLDFRKAPAPADGAERERVPVRERC